MFDRLGVFAGQLRRRGRPAVAGEGLESWDILDLASLTAKSMLVAETMVEGTPAVGM